MAGNIVCTTALITILVAVPAAVRVTAQSASQAGQSAASAISTTGSAPVTFRYNNRPITDLRAVVFSRPPAERAAAAAARLDTLLEREVPGPVSTREVEGSTAISIGDRDILAIFPLDVDQLAGETRESKAAQAAARLRRAIDEAVELRTPGRIARAAAAALIATLLAGALLWYLARLYRVVSMKISSSAQRRLERLSSGQEILARVSNASTILRYAVTVVFSGAALVVVYSWLTFVLRRFPYTRPWGESLREFLVGRLGALALAFVHALPDLFTVAVILLLVRFAVRLAQAVFGAVEEGRIAIPYVYPDTAAPTRRIVTALLWLLGIAVAYPYVPGSESDAVKGLSVFVGLVISLGSSGIVNQMMSGLTITYSRAVRVGDYVKIGDVEGSVTQLGALSTKVRTPRGEEVTIPNAVVISQVTTNYSRLADTGGVYVPTRVTIGYDSPWRQVHALLLLAAERTPGIRAEPKPEVRQTGLQDFYVEYTLLVSLEQPHRRLAVLDALHANIQDAFNEYGVQIMSPNYEADPDERKVVHRDQWYAAPAARPHPDVARSP